MKTTIQTDGSGDVVLPAWREDIDYARIFDGGRPMFDATANDESITCSSVKRVSLTADPNMAVDDVHNLIVRMAVHRSNPAFDHLVFSKKQFVVVGKHTPSQPTFRRGLFAFLVRYHDEVGKSVCSRFHLLSPVNPGCSDPFRDFSLWSEVRFPQRASQPPSTTSTCPCT